MLNGFSTHSRTTLHLSLQQTEPRCCQMPHLNHLIGQTHQMHSSHLTTRSHQDWEIIEERLHTIKWIISPTQTWKNPAPPASCRMVPRPGWCQHQPRPRDVSTSPAVTSELDQLSHPIPLIVFFWFNCFSVLDLEILSAELQYKIEKYKLEMINLQQNIKRCKHDATNKSSHKRGKDLYSMMESIKKKSGANVKVVTALLKPHQLDLLEMKWELFMQLTTAETCYSSP